MMRLTVVLVVTLALAGCGAQAQTSSVDKFQGADREVAQQVEDLESDGKRGKAEDICSDILAKSLVDELNTAGTDCTTEMKKAIEDADDFDLEVLDVKVTGDEATATVRRGDDGPTETMAFTREGSSWRATALSSER
jgi:outer membrane murein-binding lipoprotein Lpp